MSFFGDHGSCVIFKTSLLGHLREVLGFTLKSYVHQLNFYIQIKVSSHFLFRSRLFGHSSLTRARCCLCASEISGHCRSVSRLLFSSIHFFHWMPIPWCWHLLRTHTDICSMLQSFHSYVFIQEKNADTWVEPCATVHCRSLCNCPVPPDKFSGLGVCVCVCYTCECRYSWW